MKITNARRNSSDTHAPRTDCSYCFKYNGARGDPGGAKTVTHKGRQDLHEGKALAGAALGALMGYTHKGGAQGAVTGATLGGLAGLFAGNTGLQAIQ